MSEENHSQNGKAQNVEVTEVQLSPLQVLLKIEQEGGQPLPPQLLTHGILSVICWENWFLIQSKSFW